ncbi:MAG: NYN domain-containing protein [Alphaproteobacteria bacterium]
MPFGAGVRGRLRAAAAFCGQHIMDTIVYVDGFNLYYGSLRKTPCRWLDLSKLCRHLLPANNIVKIKYFTAKVSARPDDPGQPTRQQAYLRALATLPEIEVYFGHFLSHEVYMPMAQSIGNNNKQYAHVIKTEEKGSDVNLASHMLMDGFRKRYKVAVVISNDSDLCTPIRMVRRELGFPVGILRPGFKNPSIVLGREANFVKPIRFGAIKSSQFPDSIHDANGVITKPPEWA